MLDQEPAKITIDAEHLARGVMDDPSPVFGRRAQPEGCSGPTYTGHFTV